MNVTLLQLPPQGVWIACKDATWLCWQHRCKQESWAIAKLTARCTLYMDGLKISGCPWLRPGPLFPKFLMKKFIRHVGNMIQWAFVPIEPINVRTKFEVRSFTRSWDNRGYPKMFGSPWIDLWTFRHFDVSEGFAPWTFRPQSWSFRPLDGSPPGRFATRMVRPLDDSPPGRIAP